MDNYQQTENGFITRLLLSAKNHAKSRKKKGRLEAGIFELTKEIILQKLQNQNEKCYY